MWQVTRRIEFCAGHRLLDYKGGCSNIHGHNFAAEISVRRDVLDPRGMVIDFNEIRDRIKTWIDGNWDHGFLVNEFDIAMIEFLVVHRQKYYTLTPAIMGKVKKLLHAFVPSVAEARGLCNPTVENLAGILKLIVSTELILKPENVSIRVYESDNGWTDL